MNSSYSSHSPGAVRPIPHIILVQLILFFKSSCCKIASVVWNWINSAPKQQRRPLACLLSLFFFYAPSSPNIGIARTCAVFLFVLFLELYTIVSSFQGPHLDDSIIFNQTLKSTTNVFTVVQYTLCTLWPINCISPQYALYAAACYALFKAPMTSVCFFYRDRKKIITCNMFGETRQTNKF